MLSIEQRSVVESPLISSIFLHGPAGCGKTTCGVERVRYLLNMGVRSESILIFTPQRTLQSAYQLGISRGGTFAQGEISFATVGGLARRMIDLFWPIASDLAGFKSPDLPPTFLTLETAQYHMSRIVRPRLDEGWFDSVVMDRNRLYAQIIDNLNKSAATGIPYSEIGERLASAWTGSPSHLRIFSDVQECASSFRLYCLENNLLDFSLQLELFFNLYANDPLVRNYLQSLYQHIIYDNAEEDIALAHDLIIDLIPTTNSALVIIDDVAGYRKFLGADPDSAMRLETTFERKILLSDSYVTSSQLEIFSSKLATNFSKDRANLPARSVSKESIGIIDSRFHPEMLDKVVSEVQSLLANGVGTSDIAILAPYLSDVLRFSLTSRLEKAGIPTRTHRPSRSLREEPGSLCLLTLAELAHPDWDIKPEKFDVAHTLLQAIDGMDLVRAHILSDIVYRTKDASLGSFEIINPSMQERITYYLGERYEILRNWLIQYALQDQQPLDHFLRRLFGEVLSQPGFRFHRDVDAARVASSLIESIQKFRLSQAQYSVQQESLGKEYISMLRDGVIAAQYITAWNETNNDAVLISPAYTFLMNNHPVQVQFWLDIGSSGWYERLYQPLTHPYVLSRSWQIGRTWTDEDEVEANNDTLVRLMTGLIRRCKEKIYLCISEFGESGYEQRGALLRAFNQIISQLEI